MFIFPSISNSSRGGPYLSEVYCNVTCYASRAVQQSEHFGNQKTASGTDNWTSDTRSNTIPIIDKQTVKIGPIGLFSLHENGGIPVAFSFRDGCEGFVGFAVHKDRNSQLGDLDK